MSSACLVLKQPSFGAAPRSRPRSADSSSGTDSSPTSLWRPWLSSSRDRSEQWPRSTLSFPHSKLTVPVCSSSDGKLQAFQHPVKLFWPISKSFDYLYTDGEALLRNFPIQATISFYEESDSEDEDEQDLEEAGEYLKQQSYFTSNN